MHRIVRAAYLGETLGDTSAFESPGSLDQIKSSADMGSARHSRARCSL
jgi:hypothetical protein